MTRQDGALIVGGGIAGLAAAVALAQRGMTVSVHEAASRLGETGAGIQLGPNATRLLRDMGVLEELDASGALAEPRALRVRSGFTDARLGGMALAGMAERHGAPYVCVRRSALHGALETRARALAGRIKLLLSQQISAIGADGERGFVRSADGAALGASLIIGADGANSGVRRQVVPNAELTFAGKTAGRALICAARLADAALSELCTDVNVWLLPDAHVVTYPVDAGRLLNVVLIAGADARSNPVRASKLPANDISESRALDDRAVGSAEKASAQTDIARDGVGWRGSRPLDLDRHFPQRTEISSTLQRLLAVIDALPTCQNGTDGAARLGAWALHTLPRPVAPVHSLNGGAGRANCVLIGDAWHPVLPFLAQGAAMAIEDAVVLARIVGQQQDLASFAMHRTERTKRVTGAAAQNGKVFHLRGAAAQARNTVMRALPGSILLRRYDWLYGAKV